MRYSFVGLCLVAAACGDIDYSDLPPWLSRSRPTNPKRSWRHLSTLSIEPPSRSWRRRLPAR